MTSQPTTEVKEISKRRLILGGTIFIGGVITPLLIPLVISSDLSDEMKTFLSGALALGIPEVGMLMAVMVLGKAGFAHLKKILMQFLKSTFVPPQKVSRIRYRIGLFVIIIPVLLAWIGPYLSEYIPDWSHINIIVAIGGDILFMLGLFILGGEFWDKLHALFRYDATVMIPRHKDD